MKLRRTHRVHIGDEGNLPTRELERYAQEGYEIHGRKHQRLIDRAGLEGLFFGVCAAIILYWVFS